MYNQGYVPQNQGQQSGSWYAPPPQPRQQQARRSGGSSGKQPPQKPKKKRSLKWQLVKVLIVIVLIAGACAGGYIWKTQNEVKPYMSVFLPNIYVDGISLSGLSWQEGSQKVWEQANAKENSWYVRLKNTSGQYQDITADMLGISFDPSAALEEAWAIGHATDASGRKDIFELQQEIAAAKNTTYSFTSAQQSADTTPIDNILTTLQTVAYKAPQDAALLSFNPDDLNNPFTFQQESYGQWLDVTAVKEQILEMVSTLQSGEILLKTSAIAPSVTVAELKKNVELRFRATTAISSKSTEDRTNNIRVAFERINGTILQSGKTFSFNSAVGRREAGNGYYPAIEYAYGSEVMGIGGGVCQASTTVYLAAIQAGLKINKRSAHSNPVNYTEMGMDATVNSTRGHEVDFTFTNNTGSPIYISAHVISSSTNKKNLVCDVRIYGRSLENVSYQLVSETVEVLPKPEEPTLDKDETGEYVIYEDETKLRSKGRDGYVVEAYLVTYTDGVETDRTRVSRDTYPARADRYWVGVTPRY